MRRKTAVLLTIVLGIACASCSHGDGKGKGKKKKDKEEGTTVLSLPGYDLSKPVEYKMPTDLLEISGIAFNKGDDNTIYAEQDEDGSIFYLHPGDKEAKSAKFAKQGDYEDVAVGNNQVIMLRSKGEFFNFPLSEVTAGKIKSQKAKHLMPAGEYESMEFDNDTKKLYVLCKQCDVDKSSDNNTGYIFDVNANGNITKTGNFNIVVKDPADEGKGKFKFRPSAFAKNPVTKQWFIISSINKLLVVTDDKWNVQGNYPLPKGFLQPEGMAFDSKGNLYISNEGDEIENGNILLFKYAGK